MPDVKVNKTLKTIDNEIIEISKSNIEHLDLKDFLNESSDPYITRSYVPESAVTSVNRKTGAVVLGASDIQGVLTTDTNQDITSIKTIRRTQNGSNKAQVIFEDKINGLLNDITFYVESGLISVEDENRNSIKYDYKNGKIIFEDSASGTNHGAFILPHKGSSENPEILATLSDVTLNGVTLDTNQNITGVKTFINKFNLASGTANSDVSIQISLEGSQRGSTHSSYENKILHLGQLTYKSRFSDGEDEYYYALYMNSESIEKRLGTDEYPWTTVYADKYTSSGDLYIEAPQDAGINLKSDIWVWKSIYPSTSTIDLGSNSWKFRNAYISGNLEDGNGNSVSISNIQTKITVINNQDNTIDLTM